MRHTHENEVCTCEPVNRVRSCLRNALFWMECTCVNEQVRPTNVCASVKHVRTCEWRWESVKGSSQLKTGLFICKRDILDVNGTSYLWTAPFTCERDHSILDETRRLSVYKWRPHSHLTVYSLEEVQITRGGPQTANTLPINGMSTCDRVFHVWMGYVCVNGSCTCEGPSMRERDIHVWMEWDVYVWMDFGQTS